MKHWVLLFAYSVWEYWLGKTEKILACSSWELMGQLIKRVFKKENFKWFYKIT